MNLYVWIHIIFISIAFGISFFIFFSKKGTQYHKALGWIFVISMLVSLIASFGIQTWGWFSPIHILSILTIYFLIRGILAIRMKKDSWKYFHAENMLSAYNAILIAGSGAAVRELILPGNVFVGIGVSVVVAFVTIPLLIKKLEQYK